MNALIAKLCTLLALAQTAFAAPGLVLCIEPCGEVNIESAAAGGCSDCPDGEDEVPAPESAVEQVPSCSCVDVALDTSTTSRVRDLAADLGAFDPALVVEILPALPAPLTLQPWRDPSSGPGPADIGPALVGSIVLLV